MAGMFVLLLILSGARCLLSRFPHPHTLALQDATATTPAAQYWERRGISLLDLAQSLAIAAVITATAVTVAGLIKSWSASTLVQAFLGNTFVWITFLTVTAASLGHRWMDRIQGSEELGTLLLYLFFFVIGLRADLVAVIVNTPVLFAFCLVMAVTNLIVTLLLGRLFRLNLEELLLCVNATLGGAPSAAAMAISKGWSHLVLPGLLVGIWGYVIGTFLGVFTGEFLRRLLN
jgi:uncharacterized membrane protein